MMDATVKDIVDIADELDKVIFTTFLQGQPSTLLSFY